MQKARFGIFTSVIFIALAFAYSMYTHYQNSNAFFESQFLHYEFLKELVTGEFTARAFFTVYGEHLFPGYNLILATNYYLFRIWGGFDSVVYACFLIATAAVVVSRFYFTAPLTQTGKVIACSLSMLLLLSVTNTPQWGMALSATGGVFLFAVSAALAEDALWGDKKLSPLIFIVLPAAQILFLGGYAVGSIAALGALVLLHAVHNRKLSLPAAAVALTVAASLAVYVILVTHYSTLSAAKPVSIGVHIGEIARFAVLMTGASILGKAFFEQTHMMWLYFTIGTVLIALTLCMWVEFSRRPAKGKMFVMALSIYSAVNVLAVAFFRYKNGDDGAMGQWYNAHTHFIAVAVAYYLFLKIKSDATVKNIAIYSALGFIFVLSAAGYSTDWKKAPYVAEYKQKFSQQALTILAFPETIKDKNDPYQTMLWDYDHVKPAIDLMFANRLWIFKKSAPIVSQVTSDSWLESKNPVTVLCPAGSTSLRVLAWRREDWKKSAITVQVGDVKRGMPVTNGELSISLPAKGAAVMLDGSDAEKSNPITIAPDTRQLVARVTDFKCQFGAATQ